MVKKTTNDIMYIIVGRYATSITTAHILKEYYKE